MSKAVLRSPAKSMEILETSFSSCMRLHNLCKQTGFASFERKSQLGRQDCEMLALTIILCNSLAVPSSFIIRRSSDLLMSHLHLKSLLSSVIVEQFPSPRKMPQCALMINTTMCMCSGGVTGQTMTGQW